MANDAATTQLPIMVRKPTMVWPGLDRMGLNHKSIAGDGNCLFASLADQLYGSPIRHDEIRATIVDHMRTFRPLYEHFVHKDDVTQRRLTRAATTSNLNNATDDAFEDYLGLMSKPRAYGGQPELQAFVRAYDQDVMVHLPPETNWNTLSLPYFNDYRDAGATVKPFLHICYGGDEMRRAHYDSSQKTDKVSYMRSLTERPKMQNKSGADTPSPVSEIEILNTRAIRSSRSDPNKDMMHELVLKGSKELRSSYELLNDVDRARSPSATSSQYSTSSKRSLEEDGECQNTNKRSVRSRRLRNRMAITTTSMSQNTSTTPGIRPLTSDPPTPSSSPDTDSSSDAAENVVMESSTSSPSVYPVADDEASSPRRHQSTIDKLQTGGQIDDSSAAPIPKSGTEAGSGHAFLTDRPRSSLRA